MLGVLRSDEHAFWSLRGWFVTFRPLPNPTANVNKFARRPEQAGSLFIAVNGFTNRSFKSEEQGMKTHQTLRPILTVMVVTILMSAVSVLAADMHTSTPFQGPKANKGTVRHSVRDGKSVLTLSDDFVVPDTPDPHWQLIDSNGNVYLVDRLKTKTLMGNDYKKEIVVPSYVKNVVKVQIWCAFAEANLGEASFSSPVSK